MRESHFIFSAGCRSIGIALSFVSGYPCLLVAATETLPGNVFDVGSNKCVVFDPVKLIREACHSEVKVA